METIGKILVKNGEVVEIERKDSKADLEKRRDELLSELYWVLHDLEDEEGYIHGTLTTTLINRIFTIDGVLDLIVEKGE